MADFAAFGNSSFQPSTWVNQILKGYEDGDALESQLAQLSMKLHVLSQDYSDQLESAMMESMAVMPRIVNEVHQTEQILKDIQHEMTILSIQLKDFDDKHVTGSEELSRLDTLKSNMVKCQSVLLEHNRWNILVTEATNFMESGGKLSDSADRIETLKKSLDILKELPGQADRISTYDTLCEKLLSTLKLRVHQDILQNNISLIQDYIYVYDRVGKKGYLESEYATIRPQVLKNDLEVINNSSGIEHTIWLQTIMIQVMNFINDEMMTTDTLFGKEDSKKVLLDIVKYIFSDLNPLLLSHLQAIHMKDNIIIDYLTILDNYIKIMSLIWKEIPVFDNIIDIYRILYQSIVDYLPSYPEHELSVLKVQLKDLLPVLNQLTFTQADDDDDFDFTYSNEATRSGTSALHSQNLSPKRGSIRGMTVSSTGVIKSNMTMIYPEETFSMFSTKLMEVSTNLKTPLLYTLLHASQYLTGLSLKPCMKQIPSIIQSYIKFLCIKIDEYRTACGCILSDSSLIPLPTTTTTTTSNLTANTNIANTSQSISSPNSNNSSASSSANTTSIPNITNLLLYDDLFTYTQSESKSIISLYEAQFNTHGLTEKNLIPSALTAVLSVGKLLVTISEVDTFLSTICTTLSSIYMKESKSYFIQVLNTCRPEDLQSINTTSYATLLSNTTTTTTSTTTATTTMTSTTTSNYENSSPNNLTSKEILDLSTVNSSLEQRIYSVYINYLLHQNYEMFNEMKSFLSLYTTNTTTTTTTTSGVMTNTGSMMTSSSSTLSSSSYLYQTPQTLYALLTPNIITYQEKINLLLYDLCIHPIEKLLLSYSVEEENDIASITQRSTAHSDVGQDSKDHHHEVINEQLLENFLPQSLITQVGEQLLSLYQEFDSFPCDDYTAEIIQLMKFPPNHLILQSKGWNQIREILKIEKMDSHMEQIIKRSTCQKLLTVFHHTLLQHITHTHTTQTHTSLLFMDDDSKNTNIYTTSNTTKTTATSATIGDESDIHIQFINIWLSTLVDTLCGFFLAQVLELERLSFHGKAQLCVDIDYLSNVLNAMGLKQHPLITYLRQLLTQDTKEIRFSLQVITQQLYEEDQLRQQQSSLSSTPLSISKDSNNNMSKQILSHLYLQFTRLIIN